MSTTPNEATEVQTEQRRDETSSGTPDQFEADQPVELSDDEIFDILRSERRRLVLEHLLDEPGPTTLSDLSEHIAGLENDKPADTVTYKERKRVYVGLYQCHLPKLDDTDVVEFDGDRKTVELGPNVEELEPHLEISSDGGDADTRNWAPYYLATSILGGVLLLVQALLFPLAWMSTVLLDALVLTYFSLSLAHAREGGLSLRNAIGR